MKLTEQEKNNILSKYDDKTSNELLLHLKRTYRVTTKQFDFTMSPIKFIQIDDKSKVLTGNKKNIVNKIYNLEEDRWSSLGKDVVRRTIKKFIDGNLIDTE